MQLSRLSRETEGTLELWSFILRVQPLPLIKPTHIECPKNYIFARRYLRKGDIPGLVRRWSYRGAITRLQLGSLDKAIAKLVYLYAPLIIDDHYRITINTKHYMQKKWSGFSLTCLTGSAGPVADGIHFVHRFAVRTIMWEAFLSRDELVHDLNLCMHAACVRALLARSSEAHACPALAYTRFFFSLGTI